MPRLIQKPLASPKPVKLRTAQLRILRVLAQCPEVGLCKAVICQELAAEFPTAAKFQEWMADPLGAADPANRPKAEARAGYPSLLTLGFITTEQLDLDGVSERTYKITEKGLASLPK